MMGMLILFIICKNIFFILPFVSRTLDFDHVTHYNVVLIVYDGYI